MKVNPTTFGKFLLLGALTLSPSFFVQADDDEDSYNPGEMSILPPSPTAAALGQYGLIPVDLATGAVNLDIPLYNIKYRELNIPISLSYRSNGVKVDEVASWVGMGWSLNAGGVITRVVRDEPDEGKGTLYPYPENGIKGQTYEAYHYLSLAGNDNFDSEPDLYMFNFMGHTGKFVMDRDGTIVVMPHQVMQIERISDDVVGGSLKFIITLPNGIKYYFEKEEYSKTYSTNCGKSYDSFIVTACYLTRIVHPSGTEITFNYDGGGMRYYSGLSQMYKELISEAAPGGCIRCSKSVTKDPCASILHVSAKYLQSITFGDDQLVFTHSAREDVMQGDKLDDISLMRNGNLIKKYTLEHTYSQSSGYTNGFTNSNMKKRLFLTGLKEWDALENKSKNHRFEYDNMNSLPPRLSYAQDHWGYFNEANNHELVPNYPYAGLFHKLGGNREVNSITSKYGMLTNVIYPTGGNTELKYESNSVYDEKTTDIYTDYNFSVSTDEEIEPKTVTDILEVNYSPTDDVEYFFSVSSNASRGDYEFIKAVGIVRIVNLATNEVTLSESIRLSDINQSVHRIYTPGGPHTLYLQPGTYKVTLTVREYTYASFHFRHKVGEEKSFTNIPVGGVRIKQVASHDDNSNTLQKTYYYGEYDSPNVSSGVVEQEPVYTSNFQTFLPCGNDGSDGGSTACLGTTCEYVGLYSSSQTNLYAMSGYHIYYPHVLEAEGSGFGNGVTDHEFIINPDVPGYQVRGDNIPTAPYTNSGWNNGLEYKSTTYNAKGKVVYEKTNNWKKDDQNRIEIPALVVQKRYNPNCTYNFSVTCDESNVNLQYKVYTCVADHRHSWFIPGFPWGKGKRETRCIASGAENKWVVQGNHPCYGKEIGEVVLNSFAIDHLNALEYKYIAYWYYLESTVEKQYDKFGNAVTTTTTYNYDNPEHIQLTSKEVTLSTGDKHKTEYHYPLDYSATLSNIEDLQNAFFVSLPVRIDRLNGDAQVGSQVIEYNNLGQPTVVHELNTASTSAVPFDKEVLIPSANYEVGTQLEYENVHNNVVSKIPRSKVQESYIWDDTGIKVLAMCEGASPGSFYYNGFEDGLTSMAKTGLNSHNGGSFNISTEEFDPPSTSGLKMSYWYYESGSWKFSGELDFNRNISTSGTRLDEIRVYPSGALMTTYNYDENDRLKDSTDPNGKTTAYEYDDFSRLENVKDFNGDITQHIKYHYKE